MGRARDFVFVRHPLAVIAGIVAALFVLLIGGWMLSDAVDNRDAAKTRSSPDVEVSDEETSSSGGLDIPTKFPRSTLDSDGIAVDVVPVADASTGGSGSPAPTPSGGGTSSGSTVTAPSPVTVLIAVAGDGAVTLSWSAPSSGGSPITGYALRYATNADMTSAISVAATGISHIVTGLTNGVTYYFQVRAVNAVGPASWGPTPPTAATPGVSGGGSDDRIATVVGGAIGGEGSGEVGGAFGEALGSGSSFALRVTWLPVADAQSYRVECVEADATPEWIPAYVSAASFYGFTEGVTYRSTLSATTTGNEVLFVDERSVTDGVWFGDSAQLVGLDGSVTPGAAYTCTVTPVGPSGDLAPIIGNGGLDLSEVGVPPGAPSTTLYAAHCFQTTLNGSTVAALVLSTTSPGTTDDLQCEYIEFGPALAEYLNAEIPTVGTAQCTSLANTTYGIAMEGDAIAALHGARGGVTYDCTIAALNGAQTTTTRIHTLEVSPGVPNVPLQTTISAEPGSLTFTVEIDYDVSQPDPAIRGDLVARCLRKVAGQTVSEKWQRAAPTSGQLLVSFPGIPAGDWECSAWMANDMGAGPATTESIVVPDGFAPPTYVGFAGIDPEQDGNVLIDLEADPVWVALPDADRRVQVRCSGKTSEGFPAYFASGIATPPASVGVRFRVSFPAQYNATYGCAVAVRGAGSAGHGQGTYLRFTTPELLPFPGAPGLEHFSWSAEWGNFRVTPPENAGTALGAEVRCGTEAWYPLSQAGDVWEGAARVGPPGEYSCAARIRTAAGGYSPVSAPVVVVRPTPTVPGSPFNVAGSWNGNGELVVTWDSPSDDGGLSIASYRVYITTDAEGTQPPDGVASPQTLSSGLSIAGLNNSSTYYLRVAAVNDVGEGAASTIVAVNPPLPELPGTPVLGAWLGFYGTNVDRNLAGAWSPSVGGPITEYRVYAYTDSGEGHAPVGPPMVIAPAGDSMYEQFAVPYDDVTYYFRVAAANAGGEGPRSAATGPFTFQSTNAPSLELLTLTGSATEFRIQPQESSGAVLGGYLNCGGNWLWANLTGQGWTVSAVTETFGEKTCVAAVRTDAGYSALSAPLTVIQTAPGQPTDVSAWRPDGGSQVSAHWDPPSDDGGSAITGYLVDVFTDEAGTVPVADMTDLPAASTSIDLYGLDPATAYYLNVRAVNAIGAGTPSEMFHLGVPPGAPTALTASLHADRTLTANWSSPADSGGVPIVGYRVFTYTDPAGIDPIGPAVEIGVSNTEPQSAQVSVEDYDTAYYLRVVAVNIYGDSPASDVSGPFTFLSSGAPTLSLIAQDYDLVSFAVDLAPGSDDPQSIVTSCTSNSGGTTLAGTALQFSMRLSSSGEYSCVTRVHTVAGYSPLSAPVAVTIAEQTAPSEPRNPSGYWAGDGELGVVWDAPMSDGNAAISEYRVYAYTDAEGTSQAIVLENPQVVASPGLRFTGLATDTPYYFRIFAANAIGESPSSAVIGPFTFLSSDAPGFELVSQSDPFVTFRVEPAEGSPAATSVTVRCTSASGEIWFSLVSSESGWEGTVFIDPPGEYSCIAAVETVSGFSPVSEPIIVVVA